MRIFPNNHKNKIDSSINILFSFISSLFVVPAVWPNIAYFAIAVHLQYSQREITKKRLSLTYRRKLCQKVIKKPLDRCFPSKGKCVCPFGQLPLFAKGQCWHACQYIKFPSGFGTTIRHLWEICGLSVAFSFPFLPFRFFMYLYIL